MMIQCGQSVRKMQVFFWGIRNVYANVPYVYGQNGTWHCRMYAFVLAVISVKKMVVAYRRF